MLEIGCGTGDLLSATRPSVGVGIDISPMTVNIAQKNHPHLRFYCADVETLTPDKISYFPEGPIVGFATEATESAESAESTESTKSAESAESAESADAKMTERTTEGLTDELLEGITNELGEGLTGEPQTFDYIICANAASYFSDIQSVLTRLKPFCKPQTRLIISFHNYLWEPLLKLGERIGQRRPQPPQNWLSMDDVVNLLSVTGYVPLKRGRRLLLPRYVPGISYWVNRYLAPLPGIKHLGLTNYVVARPDFRADFNTDLNFNALNFNDFNTAIGADIGSKGDLDIGAQKPLKARVLPSVTVVIPARNEAGNIVDAVARMPQLGRHTEIIFVEGHSTDETWPTIQKLVSSYRGAFTLKAFQQTGKGKADAVRLGFAEATGDILMILDADLTVPPEDLPHFFEAIASRRGEFINGSRLLYPRSKQAMPWLNTLANKTFALMFSFLLEQPLKDTLCGTKVLWRSDYERITAGRSYFGDFDPFGDFDLLFGAAKLNLHLVEVPIRYQPRSYGSSNIAHFREGLVLLKMCAYASRKLKFI